MTVPCNPRFDCVIHTATGLDFSHKYINDLWHKSPVAVIVELNQKEAFFFLGSHTQVTAEQIKKKKKKMKILPCKRKKGRKLSTKEAKKVKKERCKLW